MAVQVTHEPCAHCGSVAGAHWPECPVVNGFVDLLARGVPWPVAREAVASSSLDRDQTHTLDELEPEQGRPPS